MTSNHSNFNKKKFINRNIEKNFHEKFIKQTTKRVCKIIGIEGIGKKSFIECLKDENKLENCIEITFLEELDNVGDIILDLFKELDVKVNRKKVNQITFSKRTRSLPKIIYKLFDAIDYKKANLIFYNINLVYNFEKGTFYNEQLALFFHNLIHRKTYSVNHNKIYIVANRDIQLQGRYEESIEEEICLDFMDAGYIKSLITNLFQQEEDKKLQSYAQIFDNLDSNAIHDLIGGHPQIAELFVQASKDVGINNIISSKEYRRYFEEEKIEYLMKRIRLSDDNRELLEYLAFFPNKVNQGFIQQTEIFKNIPRHLLSLRKQFLLKMERTTEGNIDYEVPILIQNYILNQLPKPLVEKRHTQIADYYWQKAENDEFSSEEVNAYRSAISHYKKAGNQDKLSKIILRFKEKFLVQAKIYYDNRNYKDAYFFYNEIFSDSEDSLSSKDAMYYALSSARLNYKTTDNLYRKITKQHPHDIRIKNSHANFLYGEQRYDEAAVICERILEHRSNDYGTNNIYAKVLSKIKSPQDSLDFIEKWLKKIENIEDTEERLKQKNAFESTKKRIEREIREYGLEKEKTALETRLGDIKGDFFEHLVGRILRVIYGNQAIIKHGKILKNKETKEEFEYDYIVTHPAKNEMIVVEAKGYKRRKKIPLGGVNDKTNKYQKNSINWFLRGAFPFFKKNCNNPDSLQIKACYITSAGFTDEALVVLKNMQSSKLKPDLHDLYFDSQSLRVFLNEKGMKSEIKNLNKHFK